MENNAEATAATDIIMEKELYVAAMNGNKEFIQGKNDEYLLKKTREKKNLIHIAIRYEQLEFIRATLERFPNNYNLISDQEISNKNTPLHIAAEVGKLKFMRVFYDYSEKLELGEGDEKKKKKNPWMLKNSKGNTAVHVALIHGNVKLARFLLDKDLYLAFRFNNSIETPLHLAIKHYHNYAESESIMETIQQQIEEEGSTLVIKPAPKEKKMSSIIKFLVKKAGSVASWTDINGSTPLHRAAMLSKPDNLSITRLILKHFPQSAEVCDANGNSILHLLINKIPTYQEAKNLLRIPQIYALRNHQNHLGDTPLHIAANNMDINMVKVLLESKIKLNIKNSNGISATSLIQQQNVSQMPGKRKMTAAELEAAEKPNINFLRKRLGRLGNEFSISQDSKGRNFLHILMEIKKESHIIMKEDFLNFIKEVVGHFPKLVHQEDENRNTPIHILVGNNDNIKIHIDSKSHIINNEHQHHMNGNANNNVENRNNNDVKLSSLWHSRILVELLEICRNCIPIIVQQEASISNNGEQHNNVPWLVRNKVDGNTPLHEAVRAKNKELVLKLLHYDNRSAIILNNRKETPLHLLAGTPARHDDEMEQFVEEDIKLMMLEANSEAVHLPDVDGFTPIHRAFKAGNISIAAMLCIASPEAAEMSDNNGHIFWHLFVKHPSHYFVYRLLKYEELRHLLTEKDKDGNTMLHLVIQGHRFDILQDFLDIWGLKPYTSLWLLDLFKVRNEAIDDANNNHNNNNPKDNWLLELLEIPNKAGETPSDLIAEIPSLPTKIEKCILSDSRMTGIRSSWGIPKSQLNNYMNSMNVIAALLATITFTTAFTVPGGLFENIGTPIMIQNIAFQVFMITDVIAMCLSTMVLICILWIMATSNKRESMMIQDFAVTLLLASLVATLMTFMTGVYATIFNVKPWIAIATLILCSLPSLIVHRIIVTKLLLPMRNATLNFYMIISGPFVRICKKIIKQMVGKVKVCISSHGNYRSYPLDP